MVCGPVGAAPLASVFLLSRTSSWDIWARFPPQEEQEECSLRACEETLAAFGTQGSSQAQLTRDANLAATPTHGPEG